MKKLIVLLALALFTSTTFAGTYNGGSGTETNPYLISSTDNLTELSNTSADWTGNKYFILTEDIVFDGLTTVPRIGDDTIMFDGDFNGNGKTIQNLVLEKNSEYNGLFGITAGTAKISNLLIKNAYLAAGGRSGMLAGENNGIIENCCADGTMILATSFISGQAGGLVGINLGIITDSYSTGLLTYETRWSLDNIGGLIGENRGNVKNCYSKLNISISADMDSSGTAGFTGSNYGTISNCYSNGSVTANGMTVREIGGFLGINNGGTVTNCFWNTETSGISIDAGGIGKTYEQMRDIATFTNVGWDFLRRWEIENGYPPQLQNVSLDNTNFVEGDLTGDGKVDLQDLAVLAANWLVGT